MHKKIYSNDLWGLYLIKLRDELVRFEQDAAEYWAEIKHGRTSPSGYVKRSLRDRYTRAHRLSIVLSLMLDYHLAEDENESIQ